MSDYPDTLKVVPIREWPGARNPHPRASAFQSPLMSTLNTLTTELRHLGARSSELQVAIPPEQFRQDGRPRAHARATHPGVILTVVPHGGAPLSFPCDRFNTWQDNLRAIALSLEALRKVNRYGVTEHGEQYRGFLAIETGATEAGPAPIRTADEARALLNRYHPGDGSQLTYGQLLRRAQRAEHPDRGGDVAAMQRVHQAEAVLRGAGLL